MFWVRLFHLLFLMGMLLFLVLVGVEARRQGGDEAQTRRLWRRRPSRGG